MGSTENISIFKEIAYDRIKTAIDENNSRNISEPLSYVLAQLILEGTLAAGYQFPNENELCAVLDVSRSTLREAYQLLRAKGLLLRSKSGTRVARLDGPGVFSPLSLDLLVMENRFDELQEYRTMIEQETAQLAAKRATADDIAKLRLAMDGMERNRDNMDELTRYDTKFHFCVAEASKNRMMQSALRSTEKLISDSVCYAFTHNAHIIVRAVGFHQQLLEAIVQKNHIAARVIMADHMKDVSSVLNYVSGNASLREAAEPWPPNRVTGANT